MEKIKLPDDLHAFAQRKKDELEQCPTVITVPSGTCCQASGSLAVLIALNEALEKKNLRARVRVKVSGCHGFCEQEPMVVIEPGSIFYSHVRPEDIEEIIEETIIKKNIIDRLLYVDSVTGNKIVKEIDIPFYKLQDRTILGQNKLLDPCNIEEYIAHGGYSAFIKAVTDFKPEEVIEEVKKSGLRGRGGGGFSTGWKWELCRKADGETKYIICNADEGDPGAYMDRSILEGNPHAILEGMLIGAYAIRAQQGYIYVRNEYPLAVKHSRIAVDKAREFGLLGKNILGSGFDFDVDISRGG